MSTIYEQLPPDSLEQELLVRKQKLEILIATKKKTLQQAPEGKLRISHNKGTIQYYFVTKNSAKNGKYISKTKIAFVKSLAQKDYNSKILPALQEQLKAVKTALKILRKNNIFRLYDTFSEPRKCLLEPITLPEKEYAERWQKIEYQHKTFAFDSPKLFTSKGERVRSKSEIIIADTLARMGISYRYEFPLKLKKYIVYPDFYCLNSRTRQEFAWEHFGMMDNLEYACNATNKIKNYQDSGFFPGKNFIITMETADSPINTKQIEEIIKKYLK